MADEQRDGIYFDLDAEAYHADPALGSTDLKNLIRSGPDYWWNSSHNPKRPEKTSDALEFGKALHRLVLEGQQAFTSRYVRRPDDLVRLDAKAKAVLCPNGETVLDGDDYDRILVSAELIRKNPNLAQAFEGGASEVSVFWTERVNDADVRCKARFDYLKTRGIGDLKSIRNPFGLPFAKACTRQIHSLRYDLQAAHYLEARKRLGDLPAFGDAPKQWLERVAASEQFAFQWVFFQAESAPITCARVLSPGNDIFEKALHDRRLALETYVAYRARFGFDEMWVLEDEVRELSLDEMPRWDR
jgi:hypothetical protein